MAGSGDTSGGGSVGAWPDDPAASGASPWAWDVSGQLLASLAGQAVLYGTAVLLVETGVLPRLWRQASAAWSSRKGGGRAGRAGYQPLPGQPQSQQQQQDTAAAAAAVAAEGGEGQAEDPDVEAERLAIQVLPACLLPAVPIAANAGSCSAAVQRALHQRLTVLLGVTAALPCRAAAWMALQCQHC